PLLVRNVTSPKGAVLENFPSEEKGNIPASPASFAAVREGMRRVTQPGGTASSAFRDFPVPVAAKTGAAENQDANTHAWFASYAPVDDPRVVVLVMVERGGFGGMVSAPVARKVLEGALSLVT
ncbi:MAG TPA: penicillin-binding transpeptidase domain-containing protein, partial [Chloroflexota bacterium]